MPSQAGIAATSVEVSAYDYLLLYIGCTSLVIMALVGARIFSSVGALALGLLLALVAAIGFRDKQDGGPWKAGLADPWLLGSLLLALFLRANISTNYLGGLDPGLYVVFSGVIEHSGGPYFNDLFRADLPEHLRALYDRATIQGVIALGDGLSYETAFYPLHPGWMAVASSIFGADAHGLSVLIFSLLGVTGAYFFVHELADGEGVAEARLAAMFMTVNPAICYLAKMPLSEAQSTALTINAAYLLAKGLRAKDRTQLLLLGTSLLLLVGFFFTRLSFPILLVSWLALYILSRSGRLDENTARRLRGYLWMVAAALAAALLVYRFMLPRLSRSIFEVYFNLLGRHPWLAGSLIVLLCLLAATATAFRSRFQLALDMASRAGERVAPWLPAVMLLAGIPGMIETARGGMLFYPGTVVSTLHIVPEPSAVRYHLLYRLALALTPFLLVILVALPWLVRSKPRLTIPLLFLGAAWGFTQAFSPTLPNLYYHIRFIASEIVPFSLVIVSIVLVAMVRSDRYRRLLAVAAGLGALAMMIPFTVVQLGGREGEDARFFHELDALVSANDVIVTNEREAGNRVTVPLRYYFNKQVFVLPGDATLSETQDLMHYLLKNAGLRYGRVLVLSSQSASALPFDVTLQGFLRLSESGISNSENFRFDGFQSASIRHMLLPTMWRTNVQPFYLYVVQAISKPRLRLGCSIDFSDQGRSSAYTVSGWSEQEPALRWTVGPEAVLRVNLAPDDWQWRRMRIKARAFALPGGSQRVEVSIDGKEAATLTIDTAWRDYDIDLGVPVSTGEHKIVLRLPDAHSPQSVNFNDDSRVLGVAVSSMHFLPPDGSPEECN